MFSEVFVKIYNWRYKKLVYKTYRIVELEQYPILRVGNPMNLCDEQFYKIFKV